MARNIVLCFDGTSNQFGDHNTNVVKLYAMLVKDPSTQLTFYDAGIGTLGPTWMARATAWLYKIFCQITGWGISDNIKDGYRYLMSVYEPGDKIFIYGFSRGAFTARSLAGMINKVGILDRGLENQIDYAYKIYSEFRNWKLAQKFKETYSRDAAAELVGVFDTVGALVGEGLGKFLGVLICFKLGSLILLGVWSFYEIPLAAWFIPVIPAGIAFVFREHIGRFFERRLLGSHHFHDQTLSSRIKFGFHALAIDETRTRFSPTRWDLSKVAPGQTVQQTWFAGVHVDVGGYYPRSSGVSDVALKWMIDNSLPAGLKLKPGYEKSIDPNMTQKLSRNGWFWWFFGLTSRQIPTEDSIHASVSERQSADPKYRPANLPK